MAYGILQDELHCSPRQSLLLFICMLQALSIPYCWSLVNMDVSMDVH